MTIANYKRRRILIDLPIQGALLIRVGLYWIVSIFAQVLIIHMVCILGSLSAAPNAFSVPNLQLRWLLELVVFASALVLPIILFDAVRLSHRWVGPIFRLRSALQALSRGEEVAPIAFRAGDFWQEVAGDFNVVAAELNRRRRSAPEDATA